MNLSYEKLDQIYGGSSSMINSVARILSLIYDIGVKVGETIARGFGKKVCNWFN